MDIDASSLAACAVVDDGERIALGLVDADGRPVEVRVSIADAAAIAMTLPRLLRNSLRAKYRDANLRYTFPLEGWQIEAASDGAQVILTLQTREGFEASFATRPHMCRSLASGLQNASESRCAVARPAAN